MTVLPTALSVIPLIAAGATVPQAAVVLGCSAALLVLAALLRSRRAAAAGGIAARVQRARTLVARGADLHRAALEAGLGRDAAPLLAAPGPASFAGSRQPVPVRSRSRTRGCLTPSHDATLLYAILANGTHVASAAPRTRHTGERR